MIAFGRHSPRILLCAAFCVVGLLAAPALALGVGDVAPSFREKSLDGGGEVSLGEHRGKVVLLDFWASWCAPCLESMPQFEALRKELPSDRFQLIGVNVDHEPEKAKKLLAKRPIGYPTASDPQGALPTRFGLETMPTAFLIDRDGVIRYVHRGFRKGDIEVLRERIDALLAEMQ